LGNWNRFIRDWNDEGDSACRFNLVGVTNPARSSQNNFITFVQESEEGVKQDFLGTAADYDIVGTVF